MVSQSKDSLRWDIVADPSNSVRRYLCGPYLGLRVCDLALQFVIPSKPPFALLSLQHYLLPLTSRRLRSQRLYPAVPLLRIDDPTHPNPYCRYVRRGAYARMLQHRLYALRRIKVVLQFVPVSPGRHRNRILDGDLGSEVRHGMDRGQRRRGIRTERWPCVWKGQVAGAGWGGEAGSEDEEMGDNDHKWIEWRTVERQQCLASIWCDYTPECVREANASHAGTERYHALYPVLHNAGHVGYQLAPVCLYVAALDAMSLADRQIQSMPKAPGLISYGVSMIILS